MDISQQKIIISLTTIPSRLNNINLVLDSILNQTIKPDEIVLIIPKKSFREQKEINQDPYLINQNLKKYFNENKITILRPDEDYGPIMKILPVILREKQNKTNNIIISIDDDKKYFENMIEELINCYKRTQTVCARKGCVLLFKTNDINNLNRSQIIEKPLRSADFDYDKKINFIYGTGGVLYCPSFFNDNILDEVENIKKKHYEALFVDDVLISVLLMKKNIKMYLCKGVKNEFQKKYDKVNCGIMDPSTISQNINRLAYINTKNNSHNNLSTVIYFKNVIFDYIGNQNIII